MKTFKTRSSIVAMAIALIFITPAVVYAHSASALLGKSLDQHRDLINTVMRGRNYVLEVDPQGKIKQVVDTGANGDGTDTRTAATPVVNTANMSYSQSISNFELPENYQGQAAIAQLGLALPDVAENYGIAEEKLQEMILTDDTLRIDNNNRIFFVDSHIDEDHDHRSFGAGTSESAGANPPVPIASVASQANAFKLHSKPGASKTIYLDFNGFTGAGTAWSKSSITAPAFDLNGNPNTFDSNELSNIISIWNRVSEDYIPFDVDVTTEDPSADALLRSSDTDELYGTRVVITKSGTVSCNNCGGVAYVGVVAKVDNSFLQPAWVFQQALANNERFIAEAISHEAGHTLGLLHDGGTNKGYYAGHGVNDTGWAPIMGVGYYKNVTQWSHGAYPGANNFQDDFAVLASNGFMTRKDDIGNSIATADELTQSTGAVNIKKFGVIETSSDIDMFQVNALGGLVNLTVNPAVKGANLDVKIALYRANGTLVTSNAPENTLSATIGITLPAGSYYLAVSGSGHTASGSDYGYPAYGSLGQYQITGSYIAVSSSTSASKASTKLSTIPKNKISNQPTVRTAMLKMKLNKKAKVNARVMVKVVNQQGMAVSNAVVKGKWFGALKGALRQKTDKSGIVILQSQSVPQKKGSGASGTFMVQQIIAPGYQYKPKANSKTVVTVAW